MTDDLQSTSNSNLSNAVPSDTEPSAFDHELPDFDLAAATPVAKRTRNLALSAADQAAVAALIVICLLTMAAWWVVRGGFRNELIEFNEAAPLSAEYVVDVNTAAWYEFEPLPNVGEKLAKGIVASREVEGPFTSIEDLARVDGISLKTVERLRPYLRIGSSNDASRRP